MFKRYRVLILLMSIVSIATIFLFYNVLKPEKKLPVYQPNMVSFKLVDSTVQHIKRFHKIKDFKLTNQNGEEITNENYRDKIYVADFFFTTCQAICPIMKENMIILQDQYKDDDSVYLLSHTVTPEIDTKEVLKAIKESYETQGKALNQMASKTAEIAAEMTRYMDIFRRHNLNQLAVAKPGLIEKRVNNGTKQVFDSIENDSKELDSLDDITTDINPNN